MEPLLLSEEQLQGVQDLLPERYLTPWPIMPSPKTPVREFNTGEIYRKSSVFGIHRARTQTAPQGFNVHIGDHVMHHNYVYRVTALYVSERCEPEFTGLCASLRLLLSTAQVVERYELPGPPLTPEGHLLEPHHYLETDEVINQVELKHLTRCGFVIRLPWEEVRPQEPQLVGYFIRGHPDFPWTRPLAKSEIPQYGQPGVGPANPHHYPVANLGLVVWADDFQTYSMRQHSTTSLCVTYNVWPYRLRMSPQKIRSVTAMPADWTIRARPQVQALPLTVTIVSYEGCLPASLRA